MSDFSTALGSFLAGQLDFAGLEAALNASLQANPGAAPQIVQLIENTYHAGRLPPQLYSLLKARVAIVGVAPPPASPPPAADSADRTQIRPPPQASPAEDADRTQIRPAPQPAPTQPPPGAQQSDRTVVQPASTNVPGDANGPVTVPPAATEVPDAAEITTPTGRTAAGERTAPTGRTSATGRSPTTAGTSSSSWGDLAQTGSQAGEALTVGSVLKGRFVFEELIGHGGMGEVYKARDLRKEEAQDRNPHVAVKILNESFKSHPESLKALQRESRKAQNLAHPNIVNVFDFDRDGGNVYMTMEFLEGDPLDKLIKGKRGRGLPEKEALRLVNDMGQALAYAHKNGVVHSDFKPGNAFLTNDGVVKVFDFGIARASKAAGQAQGERTLFDAGELGALTPAYASYEMLEGGEPDARDDIYALACVAYELLAGHHPFNKLPANQAKQKALVPAPIKGLSRRQWKGLLRGLAFDRKDRSASVEAFLSDIARKTVQKGVIIGVSAAVLLFAVLLAVVLPDYLHKRRIDAIIASLKSGDPAMIAEALTVVGGLKPEDHAQVIQDAKDEILAWYQGQIDVAIDETQGRYDYPQAEQVAGTALELYPDSARMQSLKERVETRKNQLLNELNTRYNLHLAEGRLLASEQDDIDDVLKVLAQVDPAHPLLSDPRLPAAYAEQGAQLFEAGELAPSLQMLAAGLERYPEDINLVNLQDKVTAEQQRRQREIRIAALEQQLESVLPALTSLEAVDSVRGKVLELHDLKADAAVFAGIRAAARQQVDRQLDALIAERAWDAARELLLDYAEIVDGDYLQSGEQRIAGAEQNYQKRVDTLYAALLDAIAGRRLDTTRKNSAQNKLVELEAAGAEQSLLDQGRAAIGQAYLELARESRAGGRWEDARRYVQSGLKGRPSAELQASLSSESTEIARAEQAAQQQLAQAERDARERERQTKIQQFHDAFEQSLAVAGYDADAARASIKSLEQLAVVNPADPFISAGRTRVAEHLVQQVTALSARGQWEQALSLSRDAVKVIPGSELLSTTLLDIERGQAQQLALQREQTIEQHKQSLATLLASAAIDEQWEAQLRADFKGLDELLPAEDPWLLAQREQVASLYLDKARAMRDSQRFSEAAGLLQRGEKFAPQNATFADESRVLAEAEARFNEENKEKLRLARIEGNKQTLLTQAKANDLRNARKTLQALQSELPADDAFLVTAAPEALGGAYLRLADGAAKKRKYDSAMKLIRAGLDVAPGMTALVTAERRYQREIKVDKQRKHLAAVTVLNVSKERQILTEVQAADKKGFPAIEKEFAAILYKRVRALANADYQSADKLLLSARELFPRDERLAGLKIAPPVAASPTPKPVKPEPAPVAVAPTPPVSPTKARKAGNCSPTLAGYGRRTRGTCYDVLAGDAKGPLLVVIPAGEGIGQSFAISKYEISISDYNRYCKSSGECKGVRGGAGDLPVTGISSRQAQAYATWLSAQSGHTYRLPNEREWSYAADAKGKQPGKDFNCRVLLGSQVIKGQALGSVKMGKPNGWGLKNYVGNAQEWVVTPGGLAVRGGAYSDSLSKCSISLSKSHSGQADDITGFRLVREMKLGG